MELLPSLVLSVILARSVLGVDIAFWQNESCGEQALYGLRNITAVTCYDITNSEKAGSVDLRNFDTLQRVRFFSDIACTQELYASTEDVCYTPDSKEIAAFTITYTSELTSVKHDDKTGNSNHSSIRDLVPYERVKLSDYKGLQANPYSIDLRYSNAFIGATCLATASGLGFSAAVIACKAAYNDPTPVNIFACIAVPVATILSYVASYFLKKAGANANASFNAQNGQADDSNRPVRRDSSSARNAAFMHSALNVTGSPAVHRGHYMKRDFPTGEQLSPIYEIQTHEGGPVYHFTAFYDEASGTHFHHMAHADEVHPVTDKRASDGGFGYDGIRWASGGMDWSYCLYAKSADRSVFQGQSLSQLYNTFYDDISCLFSGNSNLQNNEQLLVDVYNGDSIIVGEVNIAPYKANGPVNNNKYVINQCSSMQGAVSSDCIN